MESSKVGYWLQVGANIGILAGLILVGVQMNQTADLLRLQLLYEDDGVEIENEAAILGENPSDVIQKAIDDPLNLSFGEMRVLEAYHWRPVAQLQRRFEARSLLGGDWKNTVGDVAWTLGTPIARAWWDEVRDDAVAPEVRDAIDAELENRSVTAQAEQFDAVKKRLQKYLDEVDSEGAFDSSKESK